MTTDQMKHLAYVDPVLIKEPHLRATLSAARKTAIDAVVECWVLWASAANVPTASSAEYVAWVGAQEIASLAHRELSTALIQFDLLTKQPDAFYSARDRLEKAFAKFESAQKSLDEISLIAARTVRDLLKPYKKRLLRAESAGRSAVEVCQAVVLLEKRVAVVKTRAGLDETW